MRVMRERCLWTRMGKNVRSSRDGIERPCRPCGWEATRNGFLDVAVVVLVFVLFARL